MSAPESLGEPDVPPRGTILIVDDNEGKRLGVRAMLGPLGLDIVEAESGREALRAVLRQTFAVILMDVRMPTMDGYETAKLIRQRTESGLTPIIFFTAFGRDDRETLEAFASGAVDFIFTPVLADVLRAKVKAFVDLFEQSDMLQRSLNSITALNLTLQVSMARERAVLDHVADGIVTAGKSGLIESLNQSAQRMLGYTEKEIVGRPLRALFESDPREPQASLRDVWGCRKHGSTFPVELELTEVCVGESELTVASMRDLSEERERAEEADRRGQALRREAQRDRVAFDEAPLASVITDPEGRIERVNQALCTMMGSTAEELIGARMEDYLVLPDAHDSTEGSTVLTHPDASTQRFEKTYRLRNGRVLEARVAVTAIRDDRLEVAQFFAQIEDVTDINRTSRELEAAQYEMLSRLAAAAEFRDDETGQHTRRVGEISVAIAEALGRPAAEVELIRIAAPLHDVGKIAIPDALLAKPGKLTAEEFDQMKTHTTVGARMLSGSRFALLDVAERIALTHHEKWDGNGYPAGLAGHAIPLAGRIVAVADVFDALTHERPYKAAWSEADAIDEIAAQAGHHFDPRVVETFLSLPRAPAGAQVAMAGTP